MATTAASEGPVLNLINKRLRALRKKQNRITQMEDSLAKGKTLNKEQEETLSSKQSVLGAIEELDKIRQLIPSALAEELEANISNTTELQTGETQPEEEANKGDSGVSSELVVIEDLLNLLYFGSMFDVKSQSDFMATMYRKTHERGCCLTYDYVTDDAVSADMLGEQDLDLISTLGGLLISRLVDSSLSHKNALQRCIEHAKLWVSNSEQPIAPESNITYAALREKLNKIMASDYFTTTPEMKASDEMAAAAENYKSFHVPLNGSVIPVNVPIEVEDHKEQDDESSQKPEAYDGQLGHIKELHQDASEVENVTEVKVEGEGNLQRNELQNSHDVEYKEHANAPRRQHRGGRGGGHRGYHNGRGGRGRGWYQNGYNQNYEQAGKYYPRYNNNNYRGRGGRGGSGGAYNPSAEGDRVPFDS